MPTSEPISPTALEWKEPPDIQHESRWQAIADELRKRRGEWALLPDEVVFNPTSTASNIKAGMSRVFRPAGSFEAKVRQGSVYVRYVGEG